jgi:hypothetical protein
LEALSASTRDLDLLSGAYLNKMSVSPVPNVWEQLDLKDPPGYLRLYLKIEGDLASRLSYFKNILDNVQSPPPPKKKDEVNNTGSSKPYRFEQIFESVCFSVNSAFLLMMEKGTEREEWGTEVKFNVRT